MTKPKYTRAEIERRWLVTTDLETLHLEALVERKIKDTYIDATRLRLREVTQPDGTQTYKLGKKYESEGGVFARVVSIYLTADEYDVLGELPGRSCLKRRYSLADGSLDIYDTPAHLFAVFECEFASEEAATGYTPPAFVTKEVTGDPHYTGFALAEVGS